MNKQCPAIYDPATDLPDHNPRLQKVIAALKTYSGHPAFGLPRWHKITANVASCISTFEVNARMLSKPFEWEKLILAEQDLSVLKAEARKVFGSFVMLKEPALNPRCPCKKCAHELELLWQKAAEAVQ